MQAPGDAQLVLSLRRVIILNVSLKRSDRLSGDINQFVSLKGKQCKHVNQFSEPKTVLLYDSVNLSMLKVNIYTKFKSELTDSKVMYFIY